MVKAIFFDLGGVVLQDFFSGGAEFFAKKLHLSVEDVEIVYKETDNAAYCKVEMTDEERWGIFANHMGLSKEMIPSLIQTFYESYQLFPQTFHFLKNLKERYPYIRIGILSDQPLGVAHYLRDKFANFFSLFEEDLIVISAEVLLSKKDPGQAIYNEAIRRTGEKPSNILFVDNSLRNINDAKVTGIQTFYFDITSDAIDSLTHEIEELL